MQDKQIRICTRTKRSMDMGVLAAVTTFSIVIDEAEARVARQNRSAILPVLETIVLYIMDPHPRMQGFMYEVVVRGRGYNTGLYH